ncbi:MAG TPA: Holliday junction resolvase RuvX [Isosphaeraceae bacterium]|jgi:putative Holliday junction resolvase
MSGRILGLDFGTKRVGAALGDREVRLATPLETYQRRDPARDAQHYRGLVDAYGVERIVVGLPLHTGGGESHLAALARQWGAWLAGVTGRPVVFFDERYTSLLADEVLRESGVRASQRGGKRDMLAARILLQHYLDAGCPEAEAPAAPLEDPVELEDEGPEG